MGGRALSGRRVKAAAGHKIAHRLMDELWSLTRHVEIAGSLRRGKPEVGDIELVAVPFKSKVFAEWLDEHGWQGGDFLRKKLVRGVQVDLVVTKTACWGATLMHATGSGRFNQRLRAYAKGKGFKLNQYGLFPSGSDKPIAAHTEKEVFHALGLKFIAPERREADVPLTPGPKPFEQKIRRLPGAKVVKIRSASDPKKRYTVLLYGERGECTCEDYRYRQKQVGGRCRHIKEAMKQGVK